ncbi:MAG TPA: hypothetical protein VNM15_05325 [Candidatus Binatia bacterium]|nr:hypothetical protein [Candidatus Binatia bacterium]
MGKDENVLGPCRIWTGEILRLAKLPDGSGRLEKLTPSGWVPDTDGGISAYTLVTSPGVSDAEVEAVLSSGSKPSKPSSDNSPTAI